MLWEHISGLGTVNPRCGCQSVVVGGGVVAQCQRTDHAATAAAIPNAMEQPAKTLPDGDVRPAELQLIKAGQMSPKLPHLPSSSSTAPPQPHFQH